MLHSDDIVLIPSLAGFRFPECGARPVPSCVPADCVQVADTWPDALDILLDAYEKIGERFPLLQQHQAIFVKSPPLQKLLSLMFNDIIEFHINVIEILTKPGGWHSPNASNILISHIKRGSHC